MVGLIPYLSLSLSDNIPMMTLISSLYDSRRRIGELVFWRNEWKDESGVGIQPGDLSPLRDLIDSDRRRRRILRKKERG